MSIFSVDLCIEFVWQNLYTNAIYKTDIIKSTIDINKNCIIDINGNDIDYFYQAGYEGNIYELVNYTLDYGNIFTLHHTHVINQFKGTEAYYNGTRGVLITTEQFVIDTYGELTYLKLADEILDGGIYITDYSADAMIYYSPTYFKSYDDLMGSIKCQKRNYYGYINARLLIQCIGKKVLNF